MALKKKPFLVMVLTVLFVCMIAGAARAGEKKKKPAPVCAESVTVYIRNSYSGPGGSGEKVLSEYSRSIYIGNLAKKAVISKIRFSPKIGGIKASPANKKIMGVFHVFPGLSLFRWNGSIKNGQTTTLKFRVRQNKKTYRLQCRLKLETAPSPVTSFKIGSKEYANLLKGTQTYREGTEVNGVQTVTYEDDPRFKVVVKAEKDGKSYKVASGDGVDLDEIDAIHIFHTIKERPQYYRKPSRWQIGCGPLTDVVSIDFAFARKAKKK